MSETVETRFDIDAVERVCKELKQNKAPWIQAQAADLLPDALQVIRNLTDAGEAAYGAMTHNQMCRSFIDGGDCTCGVDRARDLLRAALARVSGEDSDGR